LHQEASPTITSRNNALKEKADRLYSPSFREEAFSETQLPRVVTLESVMIVKEKPQWWEHQKSPPLEFLGFVGSA
jgi:hypothetical protein